MAVRGVRLVLEQWVHRIVRGAAVWAGVAELGRSCTKIEGVKALPSSPQSPECWPPHDYIPSGRDDVQARTTPLMEKSGQYCNGEHSE